MTALLDMFTYIIYCHRDAKKQRKQVDKSRVHNTQIKYC